MVDAEHPYRPYVKEGKVWLSTCTLRKNDNLVTYFPARFEIRGDSLVDGLEYKRVWLFNPVLYEDSALHLYGLAREVDKKVYFILKDETEPKVMFDFSVLFGGPNVFSLGFIFPYQKLGVWEFEAPNGFFQTMDFCYLGMGNSLSIIEGVGMNYMPPFYYTADLGMVDFDKGVYMFKKCLEDGKTLFTDVDLRYRFLKRIGDVTDDGHIDIGDVNGAVCYVLDKVPSGVHWSSLAADINRDRIIDVADVDSLARYILHLRK